MTYSSGSYQVYGLSYYNGANLTSYIGSSFAAFQNDLMVIALCGDLSSNFIDVTITGGTNCPPFYNISGNENGTGNGSNGQNTNGDYETDGTIISIQKITGGVVDYDSGIEITLNPSFEVFLGAEFNAFIDGCGGAFIINQESPSSFLKKNDDETIDQ